MARVGQFTDRRLDKRLLVSNKSILGRPRRGDPAREHRLDSRTGLVFIHTRRGAVGDGDDAASDHRGPRGRTVDTDGRAVRRRTFARWRERRLMSWPFVATIAASFRQCVNTTRLWSGRRPHVMMSPKRPGHSPPDQANANDTVPAKSHRDRDSPRQREPPPSARRQPAVATSPPSPHMTAAAAHLRRRSAPRQPAPPSPPRRA